jgi:hypothetical protein
MNKKHRAILLGMLLGDGCLKTKKHTKDDGEISTYYEYVLCHSTKQEDYLKHKVNLFHSIMGGKKPKISYETRELGDACRMSRCHRSFRLLHKYLYSNNNKKFFTRRVLDWLDAEALAIWYMDDGGLKPTKRKDGTISSCQLGLWTYCSEKEADTILAYFNEVWGIQPKKAFYKKNERWNIIFNTSEGKKFEKIIAPYVIKSMSYKLPSLRITRVLDTQTENAEGDDIV